MNDRSTERKEKLTPRGIVIFALLGLLAGGCVSPGRPQIQAQIQNYYAAAAQAFAKGDAGALAALYTLDITQPMTRDQIFDWGRRFFGAHPQAQFVVKNLAFDQIAPDAATVILTYQVTTPDHAGEFGGRERDDFVRQGGRWLMRSWEKMPPPAK